jgi:hypothetical protein
MARQRKQSTTARAAAAGVAHGARKSAHDGHRGRGIGLEEDAGNGRSVRKRGHSRGLSRDPSRDPSGPKTTRPAAIERREPEPKRSVGERIGRTLDAVPDRIDLRDLPYRARLTYLPDICVNCDLVPAILDQGYEGACTGYALAAVINYLLRGRNIDRRVSPRMLYEMARRYDEWPGESYEGSSARGAMKGWLRHGVADQTVWPAHYGPDHLLEVVDGSNARRRTVADIARQTPGGAYYRINHREVRDMHAALAEVGILYCTLMVHAGWATPGPKTVDVTYVLSGTMRSRTLPVIRRVGRANAGHAVALVGYTDQGFIVQNSWGESWGAEGFALLPYEDYMLHATDVWAAQLGVPVSVDLWASGTDAADTTEGLQRASRAIPLSEIRQYVVDVGNNGALSDTGDYWTTEGDLERLVTETIPAATEGWSKRRVMLYLHGGLNDEAAVAQRIVAFRDVCLANEIYPLHIMWETGAQQTLSHIFRDLFTRDDEERARAADWLRRLRDGVVEARDRTIELTVARPGSAMWREMKENARLASRRLDKKGAMQVLARELAQSLNLLGTDPEDWELHVVAHSAGSIFAAHALPLMVKSGLPFKTFQLMAPALRVDEFKELVFPRVQDGSCPRPTLFVLSDVGERDDSVGPYGRSLLYLVSNAFEGRRGTPLLGMLKYVSDRAGSDAEIADEAVAKMFAEDVDGLPSLIVAGETDEPKNKPPKKTSRSDTHGGFDNDHDTLNSVLWRILGANPKRAFTLRDLQY